MPIKKFCLTFFVLALIVWSSSWWAYGLFKWIDFPKPYSLRPILIWGAIGIVCLMGLIHLTYQIATVKKKESPVFKVLLLNIAGLLFVIGYAFIASLIQENAWHFIFKSPYSFKELVSVIMTAQGFDLLFVFFMALLSGYIFYPSRSGKKELLELLIIWFVIIFINEIVIQKFLCSSFRSASLFDVVSNMLGGVLPGLILSMKSFHK